MDSEMREQRAELKRLERRLRNRDDNLGQARQQPSSAANAG